MSRNGISEELKQQFMDAAQQSLAEYLAIAEEDLQTIANRVADDFYSDYNPKEYDRDFSLYDIFETKLKAGEDGNWSLSYNFEESYMNYRSGYDGEDGLYDLVFRQGWHGGATDGPNHPAPGTAYWRYPGPYYTDWYHSPAARADLVPLRNFEQRKREYEQGDMIRKFERIFNNHLAPIFG